MAEAMRVGLIGCGQISNAYFKFCKPYAERGIIEIAAVADLVREKAEEKAKKHGVGRVLTPEELLEDDAIDVVLNLTIPAAHAPVNLGALEHGKHAYCEKPLAVTFEEGGKQVELARERGLRLGSAPDTFFGGGAQTARKLLDDGAIGRPTAVMAFMASRGVEHWHKNPEFYYKPGGGPMFDMGPYYLTAMVNLLGPVKRVAAVTGRAFEQRTITSEPFAGRVIDVDVTTHQSGALEFANGAIGTMVTSFDIAAHNLPRLELHGTEGSISVPDPNTFGGPVSIFRHGEDEAWREVELTHTTEIGRGSGLADLAKAARDGRPHRASGDVALHVLETMAAFDASSQSGRHVAIETPCERPAALPVGLEPGQLD